MSDYDDDYLHGRGPGGQHYGPPDLTEQEQFHLLGPRQGDVLQPGRIGRPWGKVFALNPGESITAIATETFYRPLPFAVRLRFSTSKEGPFGPLLPIANSIFVDVIESLDLKSGPAVERFTIAPGAPFPRCFFIARSISVTVREAATTEIPPVFIQAVACPVETVDCDELTGAPSYGDATVVRVAAAIVTTDLLLANQLRKQFIVHNHATSNLALKFGAGASVAAGAESYTTLLASGARYESPLGGYGGRVTGVWDAADATGEALVTEGF